MPPCRRINAVQHNKLCLIEIKFLQKLVLLVPKRRCKSRHKRNTLYNCCVRDLVIIALNGSKRTCEHTRFSYCVRKKESIYLVSLELTQTAYLRCLRWPDASTNNPFEAFSELQSYPLAEGLS